MNVKRAAAAGVIATASMTSLFLIEPAIGLPRIAIGAILAGAISATSSHAAVGPAWGWVVDFAVGVIFAWIYAGYLVNRLPGGVIVRGLLFGCIVFVLAELIFAPLTGSGVFSHGDIQLLVGAFLGHLVFGGIVGYVYGEGHAASPRAAMQM